MNRRTEDETRGKTGRNSEEGFLRHTRRYPAEVFVDMRPVPYITAPGRLPASNWAGHLGQVHQVQVAMV